MANERLQNFPGPMPGAQRTAGPKPWPQTVFPEERAGENYPGAPMASDRATLDNVPPGEPYPGSGRPGEPVEAGPLVPARSGLRRGR